MLNSQSDSSCPPDTTPGRDWNPRAVPADMCQTVLRPAQAAPGTRRHRENRAIIHPAAGVQFTSATRFPPPGALDKGVFHRYAKECRQGRPGSPCARCAPPSARPPGISEASAELAPATTAGTSWPDGGC